MWKWILVILGIVGGKVLKRRRLVKVKVPKVKVPEVKVPEVDGENPILKAALKAVDAMVTPRPLFMSKNDFKDIVGGVLNV